MVPDEAQNQAIKLDFKNPPGMVFLVILPGLTACYAFLVSRNVCFFKCF